MSLGNGALFFPSLCDVFSAGARVQHRFLVSDLGQQHFSLGYGAQGNRGESFYLDIAFLFLLIAYWWSLTRTGACYLYMLYWHKMQLNIQRSMQLYLQCFSFKIPDMIPTTRSLARNSMTLKECRTTDRRPQPQLLGQRLSGLSWELQVDRDHLKYWRY